VTVSQNPFAFFGFRQFFEDNPALQKAGLLYGDVKLCLNSGTNESRISGA